jgi:hypothetical protein
MKYFRQFIVIICNLKQLYYSLKKIVTLFKQMKFFLLLSLLKIRAVTFYDFSVNLQICSFYIRRLYWTLKMA